VREDHPAQPLATGGSADQQAGELLLVSSAFLVAFLNAFAFVVVGSIAEQASDEQATQTLFILPPASMRRTSSP
jgi:hypothetical protein